MCLVMVVGGGVGVEQEGITITIHHSPNHTNVLNYQHVLPGEYLFQVSAKSF